MIIQGDQKVSVQLIITIKSSGAQRLFDHPVHLIVPNAESRKLIQLLTGPETKPELT